MMDFLGLSQETTSPAIASILIKKHSLEKDKKTMGGATAGGSSSEEEKLVQMVLDFIESDSDPPIISNPNPTHSPHNPTSLSTLQDILKKETMVDEIEVLEKVLFYLQNIAMQEDMEKRKIDSLNKWIVLKLKMDDFDASLCKTSWVSTFPLSSGEYEYVDVILKDSTRLIVDIDFKSQFELARPTSNYKELINALPLVFVGTEEKLNKIISLLCAAAKQSLKEKGLHIPPWRKSTYMHSKWLSNNCNKVSLLGMPKLLNLD